MPKSKKKPAPTRKKQKSYDYPGGDVVEAAIRHRKVSFVVLAALIILLGWWGYNVAKTEVEFRQDKKNYPIVQSELTTIYANTVKAINQKPVETNFSTSCGHTSLKFKEGGLNCGFGYRYFYEVSTLQEGSAILQQVLQVLNKEAFSRSELGPYEPPLDTQLSKNYYFTHTQGKVFGCDVTYTLNDRERHNQSSALGQGFTKTTEANYTVELSMGCHSWAAKPLYKVED